MSIIYHRVVYYPVTATLNLSILFSNPYAYNTPTVTDPAATMVDAPKNCSLPRRPKPRPVVLMCSDEIEGEETAGGGGGAEVEMDTEMSEFED